MRLRLKLSENKYVWNSFAYFLRFDEVAFELCEEGCSMRSVGVLNTGKMLTVKQWYFNSDLYKHRHTWIDVNMHKQTANLHVATRARLVEMCWSRILNLLDGVRATMRPMLWQPRLPHNYLLSICKIEPKQRHPSNLRTILTSSGLMWWWRWSDCSHCHIRIRVNTVCVKTRWYDTHVTQEHTLYSDIAEVSANWICLLSIHF